MSAATSVSDGTRGTGVVDISCDAEEGIGAAKMLLCVEAGYADWKYLIRVILFRISFVAASSFIADVHSAFGVYAQDTADDFPGSVSDEYRLATIGGGEKRDVLVTSRVVH